MNIGQLRAFHAVAIEGGVTRAATRLGVSQPAVTAQIKALEATYGVPLLRRDGRGVMPTELGLEVLARARGVFALLDEVDDVMRSAGRLERGRLSIGADGPFAVMDLIRRFIERHPGVQIGAVMGNTSRVLANLREGRTDVAVTMLTDDGDALATLPMRRDRIVLFVPPGHAWARRRRVCLAELADQKMVLREEGSATRGLMTTALDAAGIVPHIVLELGSREAVREAVAAGIGIGAVFASELGRDDRHRVLVIADGALDATQCIACLPERRDLRAVRAFFAIAREIADVGLIA